MVRIWLALGILLNVGTAHAELNSLFPRPTHAPEIATRASLFAPDNQIGFFAPLPEPSPTAPTVQGTGNEPVDHLLSLIARAEAGAAGYDAVQHGARVKSAQLPTDMTLGERLGRYGLRQHR